MPKNSPLIRPKVETNASRHDFDRSFVSNFNQSHGEIRPVFCEPVVAGTKGVINAKRFTRTSKVVFPAFQQVDQHIEFFKVPLRYLWSKWNDWKLNINDINSSALVGFVSTPPTRPDLDMSFSCPRMNIGVENSQSLASRMSWSMDELSDCYKLLDDLTLSPDTPSQTATPMMINLFKLGAYQKVYMDHFRNSTYESIDQFAYNFDWLQSNNNELSPADGAQAKHSINQLFKIRFKNYRNDYFHNIYPSLNYSQSVPNGSNWVLPNTLQGVGNLVNPGDLDSFVTSNDNYRWSKAFSPGGIVDNQYSNVSVFGSNGKGVLAGNNNIGIIHDHVVNDVSQNTNRATINVQQIRAMFALDKLLRASAYAPKHVKEQFEARYGIKMSDRVSSESERLGSFVNDVVFGEVTATSDTYQSSGGTSTGQQLGAISGKGIGFGDFGRDIPFYAEEDSIIIGVQYFLARAMYDSFGIDEWSTKLVRNDFFIREFEHLGLRPMYGKFYDTNSYGNEIFGFQEANMVYKVGVDRNHGLFKTQYLDFSSGSAQVATSELSAFAVHTNLVAYPGNHGVPAVFFQAKPSHLNYIFEVNYNNQNMATDQFFGQTRFKFYVNAPMDVHSQPYM